MTDFHVDVDAPVRLGYRETTWLENLESWTQGLDFSAAGDPGREAVAGVEAAARKFAAFFEEAMLPTGVVHGSPGPWNVLVDGNRISALVAMDSAHRDYLALDVAHIVSQWGTVADDGRLKGYDPRLVRGIVRGYCSVRPLSRAEQEALAMAVPLRYGIEWLRIWELVGQGKTPFTWAEYLAAFRALELIESEEWHGLIADAADRSSAQPVEADARGGKHAE